MIKYRKSELLRMTEALSEADEELSTHSNPEYIIDLLSKLQTIAYRIGTNLEEHYKEETETVLWLEKYCDYVYQLGESIENIHQYQKTLKKINRVLIEIRQRITYHIPEDKKEIVFFPYKASMWDSMESVWIAAFQDNRFDVYVVPVPYYEKNPDGSLGEIRYEGGEFPDYIPLTYWEDYNTEYRRPDIIYIHNPYGDGNFVTGIYPDFYASELVRHTDMLVYIPYYVAAENTDIIESGGLENVTTAGILHSRYVIVQSEFVKAAFIELVKDFAQKANNPNLIPLMSNKFLPLGSPKFDKVFTLKTEDYSVPKEYRYMIYKGTGEKRKIILYNTSIFRFLYHAENSLNKIRTVLKEFSHSDDYVVWWRPHPLLKATIQSMCPEFSDKYQDIISHVLSEQRVIFDDSTDLYRAIALAEAYYGDGNSIAELFKRTGKPTFIADIQHPEMELTADELMLLHNTFPIQHYEPAGPNIHKTICEKIGILNNKVKEA